MGSNQSVLLWVNRPACGPDLQWVAIKNLAEVLYPFFRHDAAPLVNGGETDAHRLCDDLRTADFLDDGVPYISVRSDHDAQSK